jgi:hypothetical protein
MTSHSAPPECPHYLHYGRRRQLKMQTAQGALRSGLRVADLDETSLEARCAELLFAEQPREEAPLIGAFLEFDEIGAFEGRLPKLHLLPSGAEEGTPAQVRAEAAGCDVTLEHLESHIGRGPEVLVRETHAGEPLAQTPDRLVKCNLRDVIRRH